MKTPVRWSGRIAAVAIFSLSALVAHAQEGGRLDGGGRLDSATLADSLVAPDAGSEDRATNCDTISPQGACERTVNLWCDRGTNTIARYDCAQLTRDNGIPVGCGLVDCADDGCYGYACVSPSGGYCDGQYVYCEEGQGMGCTAIPWVGASGGTCQSAATCNSASFGFACAGDLLSWCPLTRVWSYSCSAGGVQPYVCGDGTAGKTCLGTAGGACNLVAATPLECAPGFQCNSTTGGGTCVPAPDSGSTTPDAVNGGDAGAGSDGAGGRAADSNGACGCQGTAGQRPIAAIALALGVALLRRRR